MIARDLLVDAFDRIRDLVERTVEGLSPEQLAYRVDPDANSIAWLIWHLTRIQDDHIAQASQLGQLWHADGWADRFDLPFDPEATGYGQSSKDVAAVKPASADLLVGYHDAVHDQTISYVNGLEPGDLDRVVDDRWDPPVMLGVRLVSVIGDDLQHVGQAGFIRGVVERSAH
jgi:hypothetical protein